MIESLRKLCEEPDCMFSENCVVWTATWVMIPINVVSSPLPSFLLFFFCNIVSEKSLFMSFFECLLFKKTPLKKWEHNIFFLLYKKKLFVCALYCGNLFFGFSFFVDFSKKKIYNRHFLPNVVKKMCLNVLLRKFFSKKNLTKQFFFSGGSSFSHFSILFHLRKALLRTNTF